MVTYTRFPRQVKVKVVRRPTRRPSPARRNGLAAEEGKGLRNRSERVCAFASRRSGTPVFAIRRTVRPAVFSCHLLPERA